MQCRRIFLLDPACYADSHAIKSDERGADINSRSLPIPTVQSRQRMIFFTRYAHHLVVSSLLAQRRLSCTRVALLRTHSTDHLRKHLMQKFEPISLLPGLLPIGHAFLFILYTCITPLLRINGALCPGLR